MPTKAKRLTSTALILILIIPLFTVLIPTPRVQAATLQTMTLIAWQDQSIREQPANSDAFAAQGTTTASSEKCYFAFPFGCTPTYINRMWFTWNITALENTTIVSVTFRYQGAGNINRDGTYDWNNTIRALDLNATESGGDYANIWNNMENNTIYASNFFPETIAKSNESLNTDARKDLQAAINNASQNWFAIGVRVTDESDEGFLGNEAYTVYTTEDATGKTKPSLVVEYYGGQVCVPDSVEILNPSAKAEDGTPWVYTESKFYFFNATYTFFDLEGGNEASIRFSPDGTSTVTVTYSWLNDINGLLAVSDPADFVTVPTVARNVTNANYNSTTDVLWIIFPIWFTDNSPDAQYVDILLGCTGFGFLDSGEDFHIYNKGGLVEKEVTGNASITAGGDIFEMCAYDSGTARVNVTFRKIKSLTMENAVRFFDNASGLGWTPEDQYMQNATHQGGGEKASDPQDWLYTIRVYGYDNVTSSWVILNQIRYWMIEGDEGATDEWIALFNQWSDQDGLYRSQTWNAFIEEEPAARFRLWTDLWINKANASSVLGGRNTAYYFGMKNDGGWLLWGSWRPFLKNVTESMAFTDIKDGDGNITQSRNYDLMKVEVFLERPKTKAGEENFLVCLEDFNILEFNLEDKSVVLSGVNTPIFEESKVPDMPQTGVLTPIYAAILSIGQFIADVVSGGLLALWGFIESRFPWFTAFWAGLLAGITDLADIFVQIFGWLSQLFAWGVEFIGLIATPITIIEQSWISLLDATSVWAGVAPNDVAIIFVIMFGILMPLEALQRGDASIMLKVLELTWAVARTFIFLMMRIGTFIINVILELIPF